MGAAFNVELFKKMPIVGILRFFKREAVEKLVPASMAGGLTNIEVTMNSEGAVELIQLARSLMGDKGNVGAGTVTNITELETALRAGAQFIVTPAVFPDLIKICAARGVPMMPGAMTPTEVITAWKAGPPTMVKVFPADQLGPGHIKALKAPFPQIPLMPTGGVTVETLPAFKKAGADAVGVGGPLFDPKQVAAANWDWFREQASRFAQAWKAS